MTEQKPDAIKEAREPGAEQPAAPAATTAPNPIWRWVTVGVLLLGVALTLLFALRATRSFRTFHAERGRPPREATGDIAPWMTIPYVAHAYDVPESYLYDQLGIEPQGNARASLIQIEREHFNGERGLLRNRILAALELYYAGSPLPTPVPPDPAVAPLPQEPPLPNDGHGPRGAPDGDGPPPEAPNAPNAPATSAPTEGAGGAP